MPPGPALRPPVGGRDPRGSGDEVARLNGRTYLLAAVRAGETRLIDNVILEGES